jgi:ABC-type phosphate transport system auxiliary subunit
MYPPVTAFFNGIPAYFQKLNLPAFNLTSAINYVKENTVLLGTAATLGTTALTYFVKNYQTNKLLDSKIKEINQVKIENLDLSNANKTLESKLSIFETDTTSEELQKTLSAVTGEKTKLENTVTNLQGQLQQLQTEPSRIAESLWAKSGGQTMEINGVKYKIIEKLITEVK